MFGFARRKPAPAPRQREVKVNGRVLPLAVRENARATRITLRIEPGGHALRLTVPTGLPHHEVDAFMARHHVWLMTRLAKLPRDATVAADAKVPVLGVDHRIELTGKLRGLAESVVVDGEAVLKISGAPEHVARKVSEHLKREARRMLDPLVRGHAATVNRKVRAIAYKDTKSRWGSCSSDGNLSFSWRIAMAPPFVIDYLAAHEVAHLVEMNHGPDFWALCHKLCPRTDEAKRWLKRHGSHLQALKF